MSDLIQAVREKADIVRALVVTRTCRFEGDLHCPRLGKGGRRLSNLLNSDRKFIAITNVTMISRAGGTQDSRVYPLIQINLDSIEFVTPISGEADGGTND